jgi:hypothetical protein
LLRGADVSTMLSTSSERALVHSWFLTTAYTRPRPPTASGNSCAEPNTLDSIASQAKGWVSISDLVIAALSMPSSTNRAANRYARALAHRNDPVSVVSPAYRQYATSASIGLPQASSSSATIIVVESADGSTKLAVPNS